MCRAVSRRAVPCVLTGCCAQALADFSAFDDELELSFKKGDVITFRGGDESGWAQGTLPFPLPTPNIPHMPPHTHHRTRVTPAGELREKIGWFPISFIEFIIEDDDVVEEGEDAEVVPISSKLLRSNFIRYLLGF